MTYFDSFSIENFFNEIEKFVGDKNIITNIYRTEASDSISCSYSFISIIDFTFKDKSFTDFTNLFLPKNFEKNYEVILN